MEEPCAPDLCSYEEGFAPMTDPMELVGLLEAYRPTNEWGDPVHHVIIDEAAACIREMVEWRPIETAPRDGTLILCLYPERHGQGRVSLRYWAFGDWPSSGRTEGWSDQHRQLRKTDPTHWLPLPPAPGAEA